MSDRRWTIGKNSEGWHEVIGPDCVEEVVMPVPDDDTAVERVARALAVDDGDDGSDWQNWTRPARAALAALMSPDS